MKRGALEARMRALENARDAAALPGVYLVLRLDGRGFTRLTKERHAFARPFDERFLDMMLATAEHLMNAGPRVVYAYTQSDEISLLLPREEGAFSRRVQKLCSVMAGEASGRFSTLLGDVACFDCRVIELPLEEDAAGYFRWRQEDAHRNALSAWCYWALRGAGLTRRRRRGTSAA